MAAPTGTALSTVAVGNREQLSNIVSRITAEDTPLYSMMGKEKVRGTHPEWEIDELRAAAENIQTEGDDYSFSALVQPERVGDYTQIFREGWIVSNTQEAVENAGNIVKWATKKLKAAIEVRKDMELAIVTNNASVGGATRELGGLPSWLTTNVSRNSGSNGGFDSSTGLTVAETTGTLRAFTKTLFDTVLQSVYQEGGNATKAVMSPYNKGVFATFMSDPNVAEFRYAATAKAKNVMISTADFYLGPFGGEIMVVPDRVMAASAAVARRIFIVDAELLAWGNLRPIQEDPDLAKTGDNRKGVIIGEGTLIVKNEAGLGEIADVYGLSATT